MQEQRKCHIYSLSFSTLLSSLTMLSMETFLLFSDGNKYLSISQPLNVLMPLPELLWNVLPPLHKINARSKVWARCHLLKKICIANFSITVFTTIWNYFVCLLVYLFIFCLLFGEYILLKRRNLTYLVFCSVPACRTVCYVYTYTIYTHHI